MRFLTGAVAVLLAGLLSSQAEAGFTYGFAGEGGADITVTASATRKNNRANFVFRNNSGIASKITKIYFESSSLLTNDYFKIRNYSGTYFQQTGANEATAYNSTYAIDPGERVRIRRQITDGNNFYNDLAGALHTGSLSLSLDVLIGGKTYTYTHIPTDPPVVPEPTGLALAGIGIVGLVYRRRKRNADEDKATPEVE